VIPTSSAIGAAHLAHRIRATLKEKTEHPLGIGVAHLLRVGWSIAMLFYLADAPALR
jgi:hypothetical protein